jgi:hypothetical protein
MLTYFLVSTLLALPASQAQSEAGKKNLPGSPSIDQQYVKENLEKHLHPTKVEFLQDGQVKLEFDFKGKDSNHEKIFTPGIGRDLKDTFRWTVRGEEYWGYWWGGSSSAKGNDERNFKGLRISNGGLAHLNAWFKDDVEAEFSFIQNGTSSPRHTAAIVFTNPSGSSIGANFGSQCAMYSMGKLQKFAGAIDPLPTGSLVKIKLVARNGTFEAYRDGKLSQKMSYNPKNFASGRLAFLWGGGVAGLIQKLEIKGTIDAKKMAEELRKTPRA